MTPTRFQKFALGIAGLIAFAIGVFILCAPHAFYASYGITLTQGPNLLSELRAPGAGLAMLGVIMIAGLIRTQWVSYGFMAALTVYVAFPIGRIVSIVVDGVPSGSILGAFAIELVVAGLCVTAFGTGRPERITNTSIAPSSS